MRTLVAAIAVAACLAVGSAAANEGGPTYQRMRHGSAAGYRGGFHGGGGFHHPGFYGGFYQPPVIFGTWYQRPYPTHLDFFRLRGSRSPAVPLGDCPNCRTPTYYDSANLYETTEPATSLP